MIVLVILVAFLAIAGAGFLIWNFLRAGDAASNPHAPVRRREDARDWQRRFGAESVLASNFLQPTQNEILETLYVLDHLTPGWETGDAAAVERRFLNELALTCPTLRKASCAFPLPFAETLAASSGGSQDREEEFAARREAFRLGRAQLNALEQITSATEGATEFAAGSLPFHPPAAREERRARNLWPIWLATALVVIAAVLGIALRFHGMSHRKSANQPIAAVSALPSAEPAPSPELPVAQKPLAVESPTPAPVPDATAVPEKAQTSAQPPPPSAKEKEEKATHDQQVAASQQRAVAKYPALAVQGSEINLRFVYRYKNLVQQNSPRLRDSNWPEQLAEECAAASGMLPKHNAFTQVLGASR